MLAFIFHVLDTECLPVQSQAQQQVNRVHHVHCNVPDAHKPVHAISLRQNAGLSCQEKSMHNSCMCEHAFQALYTVLTTQHEKLRVSLESCALAAACSKLAPDQPTPQTKHGLLHAKQEQQRGLQPYSSIKRILE